MTGRYVVLGLAPARAAWLRDAARAATTGLLPIEFVPCLSAEELRHRLDTGRRLSAALVDGDAAGVDRDLLATVVAAGASAIVVSGRTERDWRLLGADAVLPPTFGREDLLAVIGGSRSAIPDGRGHRLVPGPDDDGLRRGRRRGRMVAVTGAPGTGRSTLSAALAQAFVTQRDGDPAADAGVLLVDAALLAGQAVLHGTPDVIPGLPELVDGHRTGVMPVAAMRALTFRIDERGYDLLLGLRRHEEWAALPPRAVGAGFDGLRRAYRTVVADCDADVEGHRETGSHDVEERNVLARTVLGSADVVVVVGQLGVAGIHALVRTVNALVRFGVEPTRLGLVVNEAPRHPRARAEVARTLVELLAPVVGRTADLAPPIFVPRRSGVEQAHRDAVALPSGLGDGVVRLAEAVLARAGDAATGADARRPQLVLPGSFGRVGRAAV